MASGKISPRQKMINMMYLVLTALLAMNVSAEVINAFKNVDASINKTIGVLNSKNEATYGALNDAMEDDQTKNKAAVWKPIADKIHDLSSSLISDIDKYKLDIKKASKLRTDHGEEIFNYDDLNANTRIMIKEKKGDEIFNKLKKYKKDVLDVLRSADLGSAPEDVKKAHFATIENFEKTLPCEIVIPKKGSHGDAITQDAKGWAQSSFYMTPAIAGITVLSKIQNDIKSSEGMLSDYCLSQIGKVKIIYDKFAAVAAANTTYCMPGEEIEVSAGVGAFNDAAKPVITINGSNIPLKDGMAVSKFVASGFGEKSIPVTIRFTTPAGEVKTENRTIKYTIGTPSGAALMLDKMNVFYIGLDNPVTVSSGTGHERTKLTPSGGGGVSIRNTAPGKYIVNATSVGQATITVFDGKQSTPFEFRVKTVPDPITTIGKTIKGGNVAKGLLQVQQGLVADLVNFDFGAKFDVVSYDWTYIPKGNDPQEGKISGPRFDDKIIRALRDCKSNDVFMFENVKVVGPDKAPRKIPGISVKIAR